jgi:DNA-binding FadR family transcriptional regulator
MKAHPSGQNLTHRMVQDLGVAIVTGRYSVRNPFPVEAELCTYYGTSRSIVREAVKMLTAKGLLGSRPRQGTWIEPEERWNLFDPDVLRWLLERKFSFSLLIDFTQVRLAVEPKAAALAAQRAGAEELEAIKAALNRMNSAFDGNESLFADIAFHTAVLQASGNRFYSQLHELIESALRFSIGMTNHYKGVSRASVADHKKVTDAIFAGRPQAAESAMRDLIEEALELIRKAESAANSRDRLIARAGR